MNLPDWVQPNALFAEIYGNDNDALWHVRGIVDGQAVCRTWSRRKAAWRYDVKTAVWFDTLKNRIHQRASKAVIPAGLITEERP